jgi:hypothetical protein
MLQSPSNASDFLAILLLFRVPPLETAFQFQMAPDVTSSRFDPAKTVRSLGSGSIKSVARVLAG